MKTDKRKVALVGCGMVGMSYAYAMLNQNVCDELVLIDVDKKRAEGEAMDMNHGLAFSGSNMKIFAGSYDDCGDADIVCICAGVAQKPGESRLDLLQRNAAVFKSIIDPVTESGFNGLFLVATNPVDIMTRITCALSGFNPRRVLGTGTALDTARLRYLLGDYFHVDPRNMHAYVMGEHGDSEFVPWSQAMLATKPVLELCRQSGGRYCSEELDKIAEEVRTAAYKIIEAKRATYYGIGMALTRITRAVFGNESSVLTVSAMLRGEYGQKDVFVGVPCIVNRSGIQRVLELNLSEEEQAEIDEIMASFETAATANGLRDAGAFVSFYYGKGNTLDSVRELITRGYIASGYAQQQFDSYSYTTEELEDAGEDLMSYIKRTYDYRGDRIRKAIRDLTEEGES